jgi:hypothetical protein
MMLLFGALRNSLPWQAETGMYFSYVGCLHISIATRSGMLAKLGQPKDRQDDRTVR